MNDVKRDIIDLSRVAVGYSEDPRDKIGDVAALFNGRLNPEGDCTVESAVMMDAASSSSSVLCSCAIMSSGRRISWWNTSICS